MTQTLRTISQSLRHLHFPFSLCLLFSLSLSLRREMSSSEASPSIPFRSKKPLGSSTPKAKALDRNLLSSQTPEKPSQLPRRTRNRNVALSLSEVREAAKSISQSNRNLNQTDRIASAKRKIVGSPDDETVAGQKVPAKSKNYALAEPKVPEM